MVVYFRATTHLKKIQERERIKHVQPLASLFRDSFKFDLNVHVNA